MTNQLDIVTGRQWREQALVEPPAIIDKLLPSASLAFIAGEPGVGKSWLLWDLALSVATGLDFLDRYPVAASGGVLVIASEGSRRSSIGRASAIARGKGIEPAAAIDALHLIWCAGFQLTNPSHVAQVVEHVRANAIHLVLIDTLHGAWGGRENDADAWGHVMRAGIRPLTVAGATVAVAHHTAKTSDATSARRAGQTMRGSSAMHGSRDCLMLLTKDRDDEQRVRVTVELRDDAPVCPFSFLTPAPEQHIGANDTFTLDWQAVGPAPSAASASELRPRIIAEVRRADGELSKNALAGILRVNRQRVYDTVAALVTDGELTSSSAPLYRLSIPVGKPVEQVWNTTQNTASMAQGVPGVPPLGGSRHPGDTRATQHITQPNTVEVVV